MLCSIPTPAASHQNKHRMFPADLQHSTSTSLFLHVNKSSRRWESAKATTQICWQGSDNVGCPYTQPQRARKSSRLLEQSISLQLWLFCSLQPCCGGAAASEEGQAPHTEPPSLLAKAVQLGRYKRPEAGIFISFLMSCMNAIQAELSWCLLNTCQGRCSASGHSARATAVGRMSGRACCLLVFREKLWKREQGSSPISLCLLTSTIRAGPLGEQGQSH